MTTNSNFGSSTLPPSGDSGADWALSQPAPLLAIFQLPEAGEVINLAQKYQNTVRDTLNANPTATNSQDEGLKISHEQRESFFYRLDVHTILDCFIIENGERTEDTLTVMRVSSPKHNYIKLRSHKNGKEYALLRKDTVGETGQLNLREKRGNIYDKKVSFYLKDLSILGMR